MTPPTTSRPLPTISPTRLERLRSCPLRIAFEQAAPRTAPVQDSPWALVGTAIHRAIELCLEDSPLGVDEAWSQACDEATRTGADPRAAVSARRSFLRLQRRLPDLLEYIAQRRPTEIRRECVVTSPDGTLSGQLDLLIVSARPSIVDHKTGTVLADGLPRGHYERQLALYAWLVETSLGLEVNEAALFSLRDGIIEVDVTRAVRDRIASESIQARDEFNARAPDAQPATPSDDACGPCPYVGSCDFTWDALRQGLIEEGYGWGDAVRGRLRAPAITAADGTTAVPLDVEVGTVTGEAMIIDVPVAVLERCGVGSQISAWRLARRSEQPLTLVWREGSSALAVSVTRSDA